MTHRVDIDAFYRRHGHSVLRRARGILRNEAEAWEIVQEVFLGLLQQPEQFEGRSSVTTFLYAATTHRCLNRVRDTRNRERILDESVTPMTTNTDRSNLTEGWVAARELLAQLPDEQARAMVHYYMDEMTHDEIAGAMGCSRRHVGDLLARAQASTGASGHV